MQFNQWFRSDAQQRRQCFHCSQRQQVHAPHHSLALNPHAAPYAQRQTDQIVIWTWWSYAASLVTQIVSVSSTLIWTRIYCVGSLSSEIWIDCEIGCRTFWPVFCPSHRIVILIGGVELENSLARLAPFPKRVPTFCVVKSGNDCVILCSFVTLSALTCDSLTSLIYSLFPPWNKTKQIMS